MSALPGNRSAIEAQRQAPRHRSSVRVVPLGAMLTLLVGACLPGHITQPHQWNCETTRPALDGTWVGTLDGAEITLRIIERECTGGLMEPYVGWPLSGSWSWKGMGGPISGGGPQEAVFPNGPYDPARKLTYTLDVIRGYAAVSLRIENLPADSMITAQVSGAWDTPPTPTPGPLVLRRR